MKALQKNKGIISAIAIFIIALFAYKSFFAESSYTTEELQAQNVGTDLVTLFGTLQTVTLSQDLFSLPTYKALADFSTEIPAEPVGRANPFDFIGR